MIVVIGGIKGGTGKTTIATNLTVMRALSGKKVLLIDADEQRSSFTWAHQRELEGMPTPWTTIHLTGESVRLQVKKMADNYDDIIIDVGGRESDSYRAALSIANVYIVPFQPRSLDVWTLRPVKNLINSMLSLRDTPFISYAIVNRADANGGDNEDTLNVLRSCPNLVCLPFVIGQRKAFANAATNGLGVIEIKPADKKAISEMQNLYQHIYHSNIK